MPMLRHRPLARAILAIAVALCVSPHRAAGGTITTQPSASAGTWTLTWPPDAGTNGYVLTTDGTGIMSWTAPGVASSAPLSSVTSATTTSSIDNTNNAIAWKWNSIASGTAFALTTTDLTSGTILQVENTGGTNSTGYAGYFENITTGAGYALYALTTGSANTGYGIYASNPSATGYAGYFSGTVIATGDITDSNVTSCAMLGTDSNGKLVCKTPALTLIATQTASASASLQFTSLPSNTTLLLMCAGLRPATNGVTLELQFGEGGTPTWETSHYGWTLMNLYTSFGSGSAAGTSSTSTSSAAAIFLSAASDIGNTSTYNNAAQLYISNVGSSSIDKSVQGFVSYFDTTGNWNSFISGGVYTGDQNTITAIKIFYSSGNITSGTCSLYGMN